MTEEQGESSSWRQESTKDIKWLVVSVEIIADSRHFQANCISCPFLCSYCKLWLRICQVSSTFHLQLQLSCAGPVSSVAGSDPLGVSLFAELSLNTLVWDLLLIIFSFSVLFTSFFPVCFSQLNLRTACHPCRAANSIEGFPHLLEALHLDLSCQSPSRNVYFAQNSVWNCVGKENGQCWFVSRCTSCSSSLLLCTIHFTVLYPSHSAPLVTAVKGYIGKAFRTHRVYCWVLFNLGAEGRRWASAVWCLALPVLHSELEMYHIPLWQRISSCRIFSSMPAPTDLPKMRPS